VLEERTALGREFHLRPRGIGRWFGAVFLVVWLSFWAVGEAIVVWILVHGAISLATGRPPGAGREPIQIGPAVAVGAFLLVWLTFWTIGGIAALRELLRSTVGRDRLIAGPATLTIVRACGPFRRTRELPRDDIRRIFLKSRRGALTAETAAGSVELSTLGTVEERTEVAASLLCELRIADPERSGVEGGILPDGWQEIVDPEGGIALVPDLATRRKQAKVATAVAVAASVVALVLLSQCSRDLNLIPLTAMAVAAAAGLWWGALRLLCGRPEWQVGHGLLKLRRRFGAKVSDRFVATTLELAVSKDGDGDSWYSLVALSPGADPSVGKVEGKTRRTVTKAIHDPTVPRRVGMWLSRRASVPLADRSTDEAGAVDIERLKDQLKQSGRFGRTAATWIERLESRRRP
jgi:hypothetical protein